MDLGDGLLGFLGSLPSVAMAALTWVELRAHHPLILVIAVVAAALMPWVALVAWLVLRFRAPDEMLHGISRSLGLPPAQGGNADPAAPAQTGLAALLASLAANQKRGPDAPPGAPAQPPAPPTAQAAPPASEPSGRRQPTSVESLRKDNPRLNIPKVVD